MTPPTMKSWKLDRTLGLDTRIRKRYAIETDYRIQIIYK